MHCQARCAHTPGSQPNGAQHLLVSRTAVKRRPLKRHLPYCTQCKPWTSSYIPSSTADASPKDNPVIQTLPPTPASLLTALPYLSRKVGMTHAHCTDCRQTWGDRRASSIPSLAPVTLTTYLLAKHDNKLSPTSSTTYLAANSMSPSGEGLTCQADYAKSVCNQFLQLSTCGISLLIPSGNPAFGSADNMKTTALAFAQANSPLPSTGPWVASIGRTSSGHGPEVAASHPGNIWLQATMGTQVTHTCTHNDPQ